MKKLGKGWTRPPTLVREVLVVPRLYKSKSALRDQATRMLDPVC